MLFIEAARKMCYYAFCYISLAFTVDSRSHIIQDIQESAIAYLDVVLLTGVIPNYRAKFS